MPLYEYQCDACGTVFEVLQKFSDAPLTTHDGCGGRVARRLSPPALQFKGTGWYVTDYAHKSGSNGSSGSAQKSESKSEAKSDTKADSKAMPKSESKPAGK